MLIPKQLSHALTAVIVMPCVYTADVVVGQDYYLGCIPGSEFLGMEANTDVDVVSTQRNGKWIDVSWEQVVPGDVVKIFSRHDLIYADGIILDDPPTPFTMDRSLVTDSLKPQALKRGDQVFAWTKVVDAPSDGVRVGLTHIGASTILGPFRRDMVKSMNAKHTGLCHSIQFRSVSCSDPVLKQLSRRRL
jgi:hypothetical protein